MLEIAMVFIKEKMKYKRSFSLYLFASFPPTVAHQVLLLCERNSLLLFRVHKKLFLP